MDLDSFDGEKIFLESILNSSLKEDKVFDDLTTQTLIEDSNLTCELIFKESGILCGTKIVTYLIKKFNDKIKSHYSKKNLDERDGIKIIFKKSWLHIRKSNTEPIIRIYSEAETKLDCKKIIKEFKSLI